MTQKTEDRPNTRLISREVQKAETRLLQLERKRSESIQHHERVWDQKREALIEGLDADVVKMLVAGGVLTQEEVDDARA